jgi:ubiquinone/menaquinone biosynthesis C-methylase UbiE
MSQSTHDFGASAGGYDDWFRSPIGRVCDKLEKRSLARALREVKPGALLLDAGCGTGHFSAFFIEQGFKVVGADISWNMIEMARSKRILGATFAVAGITALPFEDESFDVVAAVTVVEFLTEPRKALDEMVRCLRPGGTLIIAALNESSPLARQRRWRDSPTFRNVRLFNAERLRQFLGNLREVEVETSTFVPSIYELLWTHPLLEYLGRKFGWGWGNFLVGKARR